MSNKTCTKCQCEFPATLDYFYKHPKNKEGLQTRCKTCCKLQTAEKWASNPEYFIEHAAKKRAQDPKADNQRVYQVTQRSKAKGVACVYTITNKTTGKLYIGETIWKHRRWTQHRNKLRKGNHDCKELQSDYNKYGPSVFEYSIHKVVESKDKEKLRDEEKEVIRFLIAEGKQVYNKNRREIM